MKNASFITQPFVKNVKIRHMVVTKIALQSVSGTKQDKVEQFLAEHPQKLPRVTRLILHEGSVPIIDQITRHSTEKTLNNENIYDKISVAFLPSIQNYSLNSNITLCWALD